MLPSCNIRVSRRRFRNERETEKVMPIARCVSAREEQSADSRQDEQEEQQRRGEAEAGLHQTEEGGSGEYGG